MSLKWVTPPFQIKIQKRDYGTATSKVISLAVPKIERKQSDQIRIWIQTDQRKFVYMLHLPSKVGSRPYRVRSVVIRFPYYRVVSERRPYRIRSEKQRITVLGENDSLSCTENLWRRTLMNFFKQIGKK